jgi:hypothetical protein
MDSSTLFHAEAALKLGGILLMHVPSLPLDLSPQDTYAWHETCAQYSYCSRTRRLQSVQSGSQYAGTLTSPHTHTPETRETTEAQSKKQKYRRRRALAYPRCAGGGKGEGVGGAGGGAGGRCGWALACVERMLEMVLHVPPEVIRSYAHLCSRIVTYANVCWRMMAYADVC